MRVPHRQPHSLIFYFFFSSRRRHTRYWRDWSSDLCSSDLVEQQNFEIRKDVLKYDDVLNRQRKVIYGERRTVLEGADLHEQIREMGDEVAAGAGAGETAAG